MVPCTHSTFFHCEKLRNKKGSRAKKSHYVCHGTKKNDILKEPSLIPAGYAVAICYEYGGSWTYDTSVKHGNANHLCHSQHTKTRHIIIRNKTDFKRTPIIAEQYLSEKLVKASRHIDSGDDMFKSHG